MNERPATNVSSPVPTGSGHEQAATRRLVLRDSAMMKGGWIAMEKRKKRIEKVSVVSLGR